MFSVHSELLTPQLIHLAHSTIKQMDHLWITELHSRLEKDIIKGLCQELEKEQQQKPHGQTTFERTEMTLKSLDSNGQQNWMQIYRAVNPMTEDGWR